MGRRDVSPAHRGIKGGKGDPGPRPTQHRATLPSTRTSPALEGGQKIRPTRPSPFRVPPKGELDLKEDLTLVWGHARGK